MSEERRYRMAERTTEEWRGSPLDVEGTFDPYGIEEVVLRFDDGTSDVFRSKLRDRFYAYELHQMATYLEAIADDIRKSEKRERGF